ncbi:LysR family transcriptional regulator [Haloechinothrix salitolerans]|uniref:LysR family transcriptional regulator n=1 Tax=Haloechinothrix salitolerans TaxID=926830 RepID=A0ABW2C6X3_9PSEU
MLLRQLEYLCALARERHFGRAAEVCHVSQPALSAAIRKLEAELDVQIVRRGQKFGGLTPEGQQVLSWAHRILADEEALRQQLSGMRDGLSGTLRIGAIPTALTVASLLARPLHEQHPQVWLSLESLTSRQIVHRLSEFELDVGMTYVDGEPLGSVHTVPLYVERYLLLTPRENEISKRPVVSWAEAAELPLCLFSPVMQNRRILDRNFADAGVAVHPVVETDTVSAVYAHVRSMRLSSVIAHAWLHLFGVPEDMRVIPIEQPRHEYHVGLVLAGRRSESLLANALLGVAREMDLAGELDRIMRQWVNPAADGQEK